MNQNLTLRSKQKNKRAVSAPYFPNSFKDAADFKSPNVILISTEEFHLIYQAKNMQAWMMEWLDLLDLGDNRAAGSMIRSLMRENLSLSQIILPKKYSNFLNVFDKAWVDILLQHNQHNLALELKADE